MPYRSKYEKNYETVRPTCYFDLKQIDYFMPTKKHTVERYDIEKKFKKVGVTYDYNQDWDKWSHVESELPIPQNDPWYTIPPDTTTDIFDSYGYNYTSQLEIGNAQNSWYTHTDLELETFRKIKEEIRDPLVKQIKEVKKLQDAYRTCRLKKAYEKWSELSGTTVTINDIKTVYDEDIEDPDVDCDDVAGACKQLADKINEMQTECELIEEVLGSEYVGGDLSTYWWEGWLDKDLLDRTDFGEITPALNVGGVTYNNPSFSIEDRNVRAPYQDVIGVYTCDIANKEEGDLPSQEPNPNIDFVEAPQDEDFTPYFYGHFGGFEADPCGCINIDEDKLKLPDYFEKCKFPQFGNKYPEYLEYVASHNVRYWNTPLEAPLYRKAQMKTLFNSEIEVDTIGDFNIRIGDIIELENAVSANIEGVDGGDSAPENLLDGKWLVIRIKHMITQGPHYMMRLTCVRDSHYRVS